MVPENVKRFIGPAMIVVLGVFVAVGLWKTGGDLGHGRLVLTRRPKAVMGTTCSLAVVTETRHRADAEAALDRAEAAVRQIEASMSSWLDDSEISALNRATVAQVKTLSPAVLKVLRAARLAHQETGGAFDITCNPLIRLWREAVESDRPPDETELARARADSRWGAVKNIRRRRHAARPQGTSRPRRHCQGASHRPAPWTF